jgi:predicted transposase/invertase (TIGR01784 family)
MKYLIAIMEYHLKKTEDKQLPLIYPMILYQGDKLWNHPTNFFELFQESELSKRILTSDFQLIDVQRTQDSKFQEHFWAGLFESCIKWGAKRDLINTLEILKPDLLKVHDLNNGVLLATLTYLGKVGDTDVDKLIEWSKNAGSIGDDVMTLAQRLENRGHKLGLEEGIEKGIEKGRTEGANKRNFDIAKTMLQDKVSIENISKYTGMSVEAIKQLQAQNEKVF